jgi:hypothetical protein
VTSYYKAGAVLDVLNAIRYVPLPLLLEGDTRT